MILAIRDNFLRATVNREPVFVVPQVFNFFLEDAAAALFRIEFPIAGERIVRAEHRSGEKAEACEEE